jgi:hypothetical protein
MGVPVSNLACVADVHGEQSNRGWLRFCRRPILEHSLRGWPRARWQALAARIRPSSIRDRPVRAQPDLRRASSVQIGVISKDAE